MSKSPPKHPGQVEKLIFSQRQAELLASASRAEVFWSFSPKDPKSIQQIAEALGKSQGGTTYHVHELVDAGLLLAVGERKKRSRMEKLYVHSARIYFGEGPAASKEYREKAVEAYAAMARLMVRERQMLNRTFDFDISLSRYSVNGRFSRIMSPERAEEFGKMVFEMIRDFCDEPPDEGGVRVGMVFNMGPTLSETRKFLAAREKEEK